MEITLAQYASEIQPEEADFLAQENQTGSGTLQEKATPSTPFTSDFNADVIQEVSPVQQSLAARQNLTDTDISVLTALDADQLLRQELDEESLETDDPEGDAYTQDELSLAIASLQAQLDLQRESYARKPRKYTISSASTRKSSDALYLDSWRKRIESVGNLHYPQSARRQQIYGDLRLLVALRPDGSVQEVTILKSSNNRILDQAAIDIVNLASPFEPFPPELLGQVDILEIIRTWRFQEGAAFTTE
jgi:protein TonB